MTGSKTNTMSSKEVLTAVKAILPAQDYVWDGVDEDDRPATTNELRLGIQMAHAQRGRPSGSDKTQIALRVDNSVLSAFKATGKGWQTRMNDALKDWLKDHATG
ncbi:MAG: hypothetical protein D0530_07330 [Methylococcales bacterium]|nr:MAG: hypothetical protein D0530_07330 [Methylococcales bacterium]